MQESGLMSEVHRKMIGNRDSLDESNYGEGGNMTKKTRARLAYAWVWVWFAMVTAGSIYVYVEAIDMVEAWFADLPTLSSALKARADSWVGVVLKALAGVLLWWRITKVVVLQGAPFPFLMEIGQGRQEAGEGGRVTTFAHIGDMNVLREGYDGEFWFGAVFRAHPNSDKLVRNRLQLLIFSVPGGRSFLITESRFFLLKTSHRQRGKLYRRDADQYVRMKGHVSPSDFRREVVNGIKGMRGTLRRN